MNNSTTKVSVIVPIYNAEQYLKRCLESLVKQTLDGCEFLLIDDGSLDNSPNIIAEYAEQYPTIRVFRQENAGPATARNLGLRNARGEFIMFCDADDMYEPKTCEHMLKAMIKHQTDLVMCNTALHSETGMITIPAEGNSYEFPMTRGKYSVGSPELMYVNVMIWNKIFKKTLLDEFCIAFPNGLMRAEDIAFVYQYMSVIKNTYMLYEPLYNHTETSGSLMYKFETQQIRLPDILDKVSVVLNYYYNFLNMRNLFNKNQKYFAFCFRQEMLYSYTNLPEAWEVPFFDKVHEFLRNVSLDNWGEPAVTHLVESLRNKNYEKSMQYLEYILASEGRTKNNCLKQEFLRPAFHKNNTALFFNCDNGYVPYLTVTLRSVIANSASEHCYDVIILHEDISTRNQSIVCSMAKGHPNFSIRFFNMGYYSKKYNIHSCTIKPGIPVTAYYRIFAPVVFQHYERIAYLDCDVIVKADIADMHNIDFEGKAAMAVVDYYLSKSPDLNNQYEFCEYIKEKLHIDSASTYFNSGVLVYNIKKMIEKEYMAQFLALTKNTLYYQDQDILNCVLNGDMLLIDTAWNFQPLYHLERLISIMFYLPMRKIKIIHYCSPHKPWKDINQYYSTLWWEQARETPFYEFFLARLINSNKGRATPLNNEPVSLQSLKFSFWRYRLLSKITTGKTRTRYERKKNEYRNRIRNFGQ